MPVAASAIYLLNLRGDVLINRLYRDDVGYVLLWWAWSVRSRGPWEGPISSLLARVCVDRDYRVSSILFFFLKIPHGGAEMGSRPR